MPISVMLKPASGNCNLRCEYCFYHDLAATRQTENKGYMTRDTALQVMDKALAFAGDGPIYFTFQGGEPLLAGNFTSLGVLFPCCACYCPRQIFRPRRRWNRCSRMPV